VNDRSDPLVEASSLHKSFERREGLWRSASRSIRAVAGVDLQVARGETVGLVGESGCGKSTLGRLLIRLIEPDSGGLRFDGVDLLALRPGDLRRMRRHFQIIFQDPYGSLNPRMRVGNAIGEPIAVHGLAASAAERRARVARLLEQVGLDPAAASKYPHEFSGGQRQRIGIARAIACEPRFVVADEPVTALDPPVQAQIVNLMLELKERLDLAYLFIAHDLRLVEQICDRVAVMYLGRIVEEAPSEELYRSPQHPYTKALLASTPSTRPGRPTPPALQGEPASSSSPPAGCPFHPRCPVAEPDCSRIEPRLLAIGESQKVACHLVGPLGGETLRRDGA
jgi:oligopeptide/dipeptide ABC transporter ATP-binding protein